MALSGAPNSRSAVYARFTLSPNRLFTRLRHTVPQAREKPMARAQFQKGQKVWVECVGAWAQIEKVQPVWAKGFEEPVRVTYDIGLGREFLGHELLLPTDDPAANGGDLWRLMRARNKWQTPDECSHHPFPGRDGANTHPASATCSSPASGATDHRRSRPGHPWAEAVHGRGTPAPDRCHRSRGPALRTPWPRRAGPSRSGPMRRRIRPRPFVPSGTVRVPSASPVLEGQYAAAA